VNRAERHCHIGKKRLHDGLHSAIIDLETWGRVQRRLAEQTQTTAGPHRNVECFLAGKLFDDRGNRMGPSHAAKGERRWRYYISRAILTGRNSDAGSITRVPAAQIARLCQA
jgi:site-specific DNA recombinase